MERQRCNCGVIARHQEHSESAGRMFQSFSHQCNGPKAQPKAIITLPLIDQICANLKQECLDYR